MKQLALFFGYSNNVKDNLFLFALQLVAFTLPFQEGLINSWSIIILFFIWVFTNNFLGFWNNLKTRTLGWFFLGYFLWLIIALLYSEDMSYGLSDIEYKLTFLIFPLLILTSDRIKYKHILGVVRVFYITLFLLSIYMIANAWINLESQSPNAIKNTLDYFTYERLAANVGIQPIYLSMYMVFALFAVIWDLFLEQKSKLSKSQEVIAQFLAFNFYLMVVLLSSRMELLIMLSIGSLLILWVEYEKKNKKWFKAIFKILALGSVTIVLLGAFPVNKARYEEMLDFEKDYTENKWGGRSIRFQKWLNTLELISEQPLLGTGTGDLQNELQKVYKRNNFDIAYGYRFNPHNQYLQTWATFGLFGLFFLFGIFIFSLKYAYYSSNKLYILLVFILALSMITESILERQKGLVFFSFFLLLFGSYYFNDKVIKEES